MTQIYDLELRILVHELPGGAIRLEPLEFAWWNTSHDLGTAIVAMVTGIRSLLDAGELARLQDDVPECMVAEWQATGGARLIIRHAVQVVDAPCHA